MVMKEPGPGSVYRIISMAQVEAMRYYQLFYLQILNTQNLSGISNP